MTLPGSARWTITVGVTTSKSKSSGRSQKPRNSAAQPGSRRIDSAYITFTGLDQVLVEDPLALLGPPLGGGTGALEALRAITPSRSPRP